MQQDISIPSRVSEVEETSKSLVDDDESVLIVSDEDNEMLFSLLENEADEAEEEARYRMLWFCGWGVILHQNSKCVYRNFS